MNDSRDFQDAESVLSGQSYVTSQPAFFPPVRNPGGMLSRSLGMPSRNDRPPSIFGTRMVYRETFLQIQPRLLSTALYPQELNPWSSGILRIDSLLNGGEE